MTAALQELPHTQRLPVARKLADVIPLFRRANPEASVAKPIIPNLIGIDEALAQAHVEFCQAALELVMGDMTKVWLRNPYRIDRDQITGAETVKPRRQYWREVAHYHWDLRGVQRRREQALGALGQAQTTYLDLKADPSERWHNITA